MKAKLKNQNAVVWGLATAAAYIAFMVLGFLFVIYNFCKNDINLSQLSTLDMKTREAVTQQLVKSFEANSLHLITIELFGIGGYLLVRYILDKKPDHKEPDVHWMDKMGSNEEA